MNADDIAEWEEFMEQDLAGNANESHAKGRHEIGAMYDKLWMFARAQLDAKENPAR